MELPQILLKNVLQDNFNPCSKKKFYF